MHFVGVLNVYPVESIKKLVQNITFSKIFWFLGQNLAKKHHFTGQIDTKGETLPYIYPTIYPYFLKTAYFN